MYNTKTTTDILGRSTPGSPQLAARSSRRRILAVTIATSLVLFLATACSAPAGHTAGNGEVTALIVIAMIAGVAMLRAVGRIFGELVRILTDVASALAKLGLIAVVTVGAIVVAFAMLAQ